MKLNKKELRALWVLKNIPSGKVVCVIGDSTTKELCDTLLKLHKRFPRKVILGRISDNYIFTAGGEND